MDAKFQPSFIPRQTIPSISRGMTARVNLLYVAATVIFIVTLGLMGAAFLAERSLSQDVEALDQQLITAESSFELSTIEELKRVSARIGIAKTLLTEHIALSKFLDIIGDYTYANVAFSGLQVSVEDNGAVSVALDGHAGSYNTIILQSDLLKRVTFLTGQTFSNFDLDESGSVAFTFTAVLKPSLVEYKQYVTGEE